MQKLEQIYEGKAKKVFRTDDPELYIVDYKDDATAFNGLKKGTIAGKGVHQQSDDQCPDAAAGEGRHPHPLREGTERAGDAGEEGLHRAPGGHHPQSLRRVLRQAVRRGGGASCSTPPTIEFSYKNDELGDPLLNSYHALALKLATAEEIETIKKYAFAVNDILKAFWKECGVILVDFKLEFGRLTDGTIVLADEISPDTCRLWDEKTHEKLDKDRFRRDLGGRGGCLRRDHEEAAGP